MSGEAGTGEAEGAEVEVLFFQLGADQLGADADANVALVRAHARASVDAWLPFTDAEALKKILLGMAIDAHPREAILTQPEHLWTPAIDADATAATVRRCASSPAGSTYTPGRKVPG